MPVRAPERLPLPSGKSFGVSLNFVYTDKKQVGIAFTPTMILESHTWLLWLLGLFHAALGTTRSTHLHSVGQTQISDLDDGVGDVHIRRQNQTSLNGMTSLYVCFLLFPDFVYLCVFIIRLAFRGRSRAPDRPKLPRWIEFTRRCSLGEKHTAHSRNSSGACSASTAFPR